jgi:hypothetical protein
MRIKSIASGYSEVVENPYRKDPSRGYWAFDSKGYPRRVEAGNGANEQTSLTFGLLQGLWPKLALELDGAIRKLSYKWTTRRIVQRVCLRQMMAIL